MTRVRLLPSMRLSTQSWASTIVEVLKKKMTPIDVYGDLEVIDDEEAKSRVE